MPNGRNTDAKAVPICGGASNTESGYQWGGFDIRILPGREFASEFKNPLETYICR
jgi:hypothetical protein